VIRQGAAARDPAVSESNLLDTVEIGRLQHVTSDSRRQSNDVASAAAAVAALDS